jgi:DNA-binding transcriptional LysR family regulator
MRYEQVRQFIAVAQTGNFRKASKEIGISQPALTRSIQNLEHFFNAPLFDRLPTGVVLTEYGRTVLEWAQNAITNTDNIIRHIQLLRSMSTGKLIIGTGAYFADSFLAEALGKVIKKNPSLNIKVIRIIWNNAERMLLNREIDLFLGWTDENKTVKDITVKTIITDPIVLFTRKGHPLLRRYKPDLDDVFKYPIAGPMVPDEVQEKIDRFRYEFTGVDQPLLAVEFDSYSEVRKIVQLSDCVGGLPETIMLPYFTDGSFEKLPVSFPGLTGRAGISYLKGRTLLPAMELIVEELTKIVQEGARELGLNGENSGSGI